MMLRRPRLIVQDILIFLLIATAVPKITEANFDSCPISIETVQVVSRCPETKKEMEVAATKRNCSFFANKCNEPDKLQYHCVINPYINQTLEVCAYVQNIVSGYCAEYNIQGNLIQANFKTNCTAFKTKQCPKFYRSTDAYLYPGCYELLQKSVPASSSSAATIHSTLFTATETSTVSYDVNRIKDDENTDRSTQENTVPVVVIVLITMIIIVLIVLIKKRKNILQILHKRNYRERIDQNMQPEEAENNLFLQEATTDNGDSVITPSGLLFDSGCEKKGAVQTEDEEQELLLNEETEEEECARLVRIMNEAIEMIAVSRDEKCANDEQEKVLQEIYTNPSYLVDEPIEKIREATEKMKTLEEYFKRAKIKEITSEDKVNIQPTSKAITEILYINN